MTRALLFLTTVGVVVSTVGPASAGQLAQMTTPTRNIGCIASKMDGKANLRCDIRVHSYVPPARPRSCPLDYGDSFSLGATGAARWTCHGDTALPAPGVAGFVTVRYGRDWTWGPFTCRVRMTGVTCRNTSGRGFFLSKQAARRV